MATTKHFEALDGAGSVYITRFAGPNGEFRIQIDAAPSKGKDAVLNFAWLETKAMGVFLTRLVNEREKK